MDTGSIRGVQALVKVGQKAKTHSGLQGTVIALSKWEAWFQVCWEIGLSQTASEWYRIGSAEYKGLIFE